MKKIILFLLLSIAGYGQIVPTGQEQDFDYGIRNTASQLDDNAVFLTVQDATGVQGKSTASVWAKKIYVDNADAKKQFLSTGLLKNGLLQANVNTTLFDITAGTGIISNFDNPDASTSDIIIFPSFTGILSPYLTTSNITYVAVNSVPAIVMQASPFTDTQRRDLIILGAIVHSNLTTINTINNISAPSNADTNQLHDLMEAIGALNISGNKYSANGANLSLNKSAGDIFKLGINFANNWKDPHKLTIDAQTLLTLRYRTQNGTEGTDVTVLNPSVYDLNNVLTSVPSNRFSIQTVTLFQSGITRVQYGQNTYATMSEAEAAINTRAYVVEPNIALNGIARAYIILKNNATSLQNASDAKIVEAQKFGGSTSGGVALTNASIIAALGFTPANDIDVVKLTTNQSISGVKTFSNIINLADVSANSTSGFVNKNNLPFIHNFYFGTNPVSGGTGKNINIGVNSGNFNPTNNAYASTMVGFESGLFNKNGFSNTGIGYYALRLNEDGAGNTAVGTYSLGNSKGSQNTSIGWHAQRLAETGVNNTSVGVESLAALATGSRNTAIGWSAGLSNISGEDNLFIGYNAGSSETGSNQLYIANKDRTLIGGDFLASSLYFDSSQNDFLTGQTSKIRLSGSGSISIITWLDRLNAYQNAFLDAFDYRFRMSGTDKVVFSNSGDITATSFNGSATLTGIPTAPTATAGTNTTQIATMAALQVVARPYKVYTALLSQTGTNAPTAIVQENTIGSIVWSRTVAGNYFATLSGAYTTDKTTVFITNGASNATYIHGSAVSTTNVNVVTLDDGQIDRATIEIRVYN